MSGDQRRRGKSVESHLRLALTQAEALQQLTKRDESYISDCKLVQTRIRTLSMLASDKKQEKLGKLKGQLAEAQSEIKRLASENETLKRELASARAKTTVSNVSAVEEALAKYEASKGGIS